MAPPKFSPTRVSDRPSNVAVFVHGLANFAHHRAQSNGELITQRCIAECALVPGEKLLGLFRSSGNYVLTTVRKADELATGLERAFNSEGYHIRGVAVVPERVLVRALRALQDVADE